MKIVFMGTPEFAVPSLRRLLDTGAQVPLVITQPDKPKGRGHKLMPTPVKELALERGIAVCQPETLRRNDVFYEQLKEIAPDLLVVVAYGKILPERFLKLPRFGAVNIHASLLPKYRGAGPIQWAVIQGEEKTGVTSMQMKKGIDTGDMLVKRETEILPGETAGELAERLSLLGADVLEETLHQLENGTLRPQAQDDSLSTHAPMLEREMGRIDWTQGSDAICSLICGLNPWPYAFTFYQGAPVKIHKAVKAEGSFSSGAAGEILAYEKGRGLLVRTGDGALYIHTAQFAGSKPMPIDAYVLGHSVQIGELLKGE